MSLLTKPEDLKQSVKFKGLIYGQPGIGKSTLALSAPTPVCIDTDHGMKRVEPQHRVPFLDVSSYEEILELLKSDEIAPFETLVFDTAGEVLTFMEPYLIKQNPKNAKSNGSLSLQGYGERKKEFANLLKQIELKNKSVIFVAHEKEEKDGDTKIVRPDISGSSCADIIKMLDFVGYMEAKGTKRTVSFFPTEKYYAKNSLQLDEIIEVPNLKNGANENTFISERIVKSTQDRLEAQADLRNQYNNLIETAEGFIANIPDCNAVIEEFKNLPVIWDSKKRLFNMLKTAAESKGFVFDGKAGKFVSTQPKTAEKKAAATADETKKEDVQPEKQTEAEKTAEV